MICQFVVVAGFGPALQRAPSDVRREGGGSAGAETRSLRHQGSLQDTGACRVSPDTVG